MTPVTPEVSPLVIAFSALNLIISIAIPIVLFIVFHKKFGCKAAPFLLGAAAFIVFAYILESMCHLLFGLNDPNSPIVNNIWLYALYGGFMAGLFEETGRFVTMKFLLKKYHSDDRNALMYGAGHGGVEALIVLGFVSLNNIIYSLIINSGMESTLLDSAPSEEVRAQLHGVIDQLKTLNAPLLLLSPLERFFAVASHIAQSVLVWFAVTRKGKAWLYPVTVVIHAAVDGIAVLALKFTDSMIITEIIVGVDAAVVCFISYRVWKAEHRPADVSVGQINNNNDQGDMT